MSKLEKLGSIIILGLAMVIASATGNDGYSPLFLLMMIGIGSIPTLCKEVEEDQISVVKRDDSSAASIAMKRAKQLIIENGSRRGALTIYDLTLDDLFTMYIIHRDKFMAVEKDLYTRALKSGTKEEERKYLIAPLMRIGVIQKEERFYDEVRLAF